MFAVLLGNIFQEKKQHRSILFAGWANNNVLFKGKFQFIIFSGGKVLSPNYLSGGAYSLCLLTSMSK